jgi:hypothetical protein
MKKLVSRLGRRSLLVVAVALTAVGGVAYASIPDSAGVITACRQNVNGGLRLIDPSAGAHCTPAETLVTWNQGGPTGPKGPAGDKGPLGDKGPTGDKGAVGDAGPAGDQGAVGDKGPAGDKGLPGDKGPTGDKGLTGDKGGVGDKGPVGDPGPSGTAQLYTKSLNTNVVAVPPVSFGTEATLISMAVPAGDYLVHGKVELINGSATIGTAVCLVNGGNEGAAVTTIPLNSAATLSVVQSVHLGAPGAIHMGCYIGNGFAAQQFTVANNVTLYAVPFTSVTTLP